MRAPKILVPRYPAPQDMINQAPTPREFKPDFSVTYVRI